MVQRSSEISCGRCVVLATPPRSEVTQLFLMVCGSEQNLRTLSKLGGEKAVHNLSRYADEQKVRQQATVLLTKLAVLNNPQANTRSRAEFATES